MRLTWRDGVATILVAAIIVPYVGYLAAGSMPFIEDTTGMAAVGLVFGIAAAAIGDWVVTRAGDFLRNLTVGAMAVSAVLGLGALVSENLLDATTRDIVLGAFMVTLIAQWALAIMRHAGILTFEAAQPSQLGHA